MHSVHYRSMMSSSDTIIWHIEGDPQLRSTVMAVWLLDRTPEPERMRVSIDRMVESIPRLRERVQPGRPRPSWVPVDDIDLAHHFVEQDLAGGGGLDAALQVAQDWVREPFDRARPLWRLGLLTGLDGDRSAVLIKVHHSIADGMGLVLMLGAFCDLEADPAPRPDQVEASPPRVVYSPVRRLRTRLARATGRAIRRPLAAAIDAVRCLASTVRLVWPHRTPHSSLMTGRSGVVCLDVRRLSLDHLKSVARTTGTTLNDVFVTVVVDAVDRYHARHGHRCDRLRLHVPIDTRTERTAHLAGNEFVPARTTMQLADHPLDQRLRQTSDQLVALRAEPALRMINPVSALVQRLGRPISVWIVAGMMKGVDVLPSNVPGPSFPLFLAGGRIEEFYAFGPPAGASMNVTLFSYDGDVHLGITTDDAAVDDRVAFLECLDESLDAVLAMADSALTPAV